MLLAVCVSLSGCLLFVSNSLLEGERGGGRRGRERGRGEDWWRPKLLTVPKGPTRMRGFWTRIFFGGHGFEIAHILRSMLDFLVTGAH